MSRVGAAREVGRAAEDGPNRVHSGRRSAGQEDRRRGGPVGPSPAVAVVPTGVPAASRRVKATAPPAAGPVGVVTAAVKVRDCAAGLAAVTPAAAVTVVAAGVAVRTPGRNVNV
jgi:hypothetical protein